MSVADIVQRISDVAEDAQHVVLTGGEPMLPREVDKLCEAIHQSGFHITIETAGTIFKALPCDLISISPKFSNSDPDENRAGEWRQKHIAARHRPQIVQQLIAAHDYQLKFVVDQPCDLTEIKDYIGQFPELDHSRILLMPQGISQAELEKKAKWLEPICAETGFRFCSRKHIEWYGNKRGT